MTLEPTQERGTWTVDYVALRDDQNQRFIYASELQAAGYATTLKVVD